MNVELCKCINRLEFIRAYTHTMNARSFFVLLLLPVTIIVDALCTQGPGPTITALNQTCVRFTGANTVDHCSPKGDIGLTGATGATGAMGATGAPGATGPAPSVLQLDDRCATITGVGNAVVCAPALPAIAPVNTSCLTFGSTTICGPKGDTGSPAPEPTINAINSSCVAIGSVTICGPTGPTGATGAPGVTPRTSVVDGTTYALTVAGVQAAIDARNAAGGGTVSLAGDILVSGTSIQMRAKTTLDCNGYSIKAHPTDVVADGMVRNIQASVVGYYDVLRNATRGTRNITLSPADSLSFIPGDSMDILNCRMPGYPQTAVPYHSFHVYEVDYVTGVVTLRNPLPWDCFADGIAGSLAQVARVRPIADVTVRNCVFDANGNTAGAFTMFHTRFGLRYKAENIRFIGRPPSAFTPFYSLETLDATFRDFYTVDVKLSSAGRDFSFQACENCLIDNIHTAGGTGFGPNLVSSHDTVVQNVWSHSHEHRNFRVDSSYRNILRNVFVGGGWGDSTGSGIFVSFGSAHNIIDGLVTVGNHGIGLSFSQAGDDNNQITGLLAYANEGTDIGIVSPVTGNYISGNFEWNDGAGADLPGQNTLSRVCGNRGLTAYTPRGPPFAATTDLKPYELAVTRANNTHLIESYRGADGNVRVFVKEYI